LVRQRDRLFEALTVIANNCLVKQVDVEEILAPLRKR
jgi:hypothetical protein